MKAIISLRYFLADQFKIITLWFDELI